MVQGWPGTSKGERSEVSLSVLWLLWVGGGLPEGELSGATLAKTRAAFSSWAYPASRLLGRKLRSTRHRCRHHHHLHRCLRCRPSHLEHHTRCFFFLGLP